MKGSNMATIKDLKFDDKNFNRHTSYGMSLIEKSLRENGAGRSILIDKDGNIIAGNGIVETAGQIGLDKVKVIETTGDEIIAVKRTDISLNSKKGREMALADNATAKADIEWDEENLKSEFDDATLKEWVGEQDWLDNEPDEVVEDEAPEVNESEPAASELGKVYQLGEHRLMCGDSTDAGSVAILMNGQKADMVFTDPPYGVSANGGRGDTKRKLNMQEIINDNLRKDELVDFLQLCFSTMPIKNGTSVYICYPWATQEEFTKAIRGSGFILQNCIIWRKNVFGLNGFRGYRPQYEMIYFCSNGKEYQWYGDLAQSNVWDFNRSTEHIGNHPTPKPVELITKALSNSSKKDDVILDIFGGSGSTLIACEQTGRKCYMMELDPKYCDVIRKRYWKFKTGSEEGWQDGTKAIL